MPTDKSNTAQQDNQKQSHIIVSINSKKASDTV
jgi:hypothetical protein